MNENRKETNVSAVIDLKKQRDYPWVMLCVNRVYKQWGSVQENPIPRFLFSVQEEAKKNSEWKQKHADSLCFFEFEKGKQFSRKKDSKK